ncbi:four helix bundle protein [Candidatus Microgenomates bacterium]|nr:four helix bundle protein [Candidatus Microgenomates bacterium]
MKVEKYNRELKMSLNKEWKKLFLKRLLRFAVSIVKLANELPKTPAGFAISSQVIKAGTSVGANVEEAQDASSSRDFVQKLSISLREARETHYWLEVIKMAELLPSNNVKDEQAECSEIIAILTSSVRSSKLKFK